MRRLILPVLAPLVLAGCQDKAEPPPPIRPVLTLTVASEDAETFGPFAGTVEPRYQSQLGFRIGGRIVARDVFVGDLVSKGARLAALDPTVQQFALVQARADVANAEAQRKNASSAEGRQRTLFESNSAVTQAQLDSAVANRDTANARLVQAKAALEKAQDELSYATLTAGFDGVVTAWSAEIGQVVPPGQVVATIARPDIREAVVDIPDVLVGEMSKDAEFTVTLQEVPDVTARARVREIGPSAEASTRTRRVRMTLIDPPDAFRLGTTITVALKRRVRSRIMIPDTALVEAEGRTSVWIVTPDGKSLKQRAVTVADRDEGRVFVADGLKAGDTIAVAGVHGFTDGQAIRPRETGL